MAYTAEQVASFFEDSSDYNLGFDIEGQENLRFFSTEGISIQ